MRTRSIAFNRRLPNSIQAGITKLAALFLACAISPWSHADAFRDDDWSAVGGVGVGPNDRIYVAAVDDAGNLYIGGKFTSVAGVAANHIAKWDGTNWSSLGTGINQPNVRAIMTSGTDVYVGGRFTLAGGVAVSNVAKWDGRRWSSLGSGVNSGLSGFAMRGEDLYAAGLFTTAGGVAANHIAKWDGTSWSPLGSGLTGNNVRSLVFLEDDLYAAGNFTAAGGRPVNYIAKWDGNSWFPLGRGLGDGDVNELVLLGTDLYAAGPFSSAGGAPGDYIAKWDGTTWSSVGGGANAQVESLAVSGTDLYAAGYFSSIGGVAANGIAKWDGSAWSPLGSGISDSNFGSPSPEAMAISGNTLYVGGRMNMAGGKPAPFLAQAIIEVLMPERPQLEMLGYDGAAHLRVSGRAGGTIVIEASADMESWDPIIETVLGSEPVELSDPEALGHPKRLYRAVDTGR